MYDKLTSKLRKGYKIIKNSSRSLRRYSQNATSSSRNNHASSNAASSSKDATDQRDNSSVDNTGREYKELPPLRNRYNVNLQESSRWLTIFENDQYKNWLKVGLALRSTCDAVAPLVDRVLIDFHLQLRDKYENNSNIGWQRELIRDVSKLHRQSIKHSEVWRRSDVNKWLSVDDGPWEIAKVFMPKGSRRPCDVTTAKSLDVTGMLNLMTQFLPFENYFSDLHQIRNKAMHSPRLEFTVEELNFCFDGIQNFLHDNVLKEHLSLNHDYDSLIQDIAKLQSSDFNFVTAIKSSFDLLEDRLESEQNDETPYPAAMSSNRELLKNLRRVFSSGEVTFSVDTKVVEEKLTELEYLLSEQQSLAEEKITLLFSKANYLQRQLDHVRNSFADKDFTKFSQKFKETDDSTYAFHTTQGNRKRKNRKRNRKNRRNSAQCTSQTKLTQKKTSNFSLKVKKSRSYLQNRRQKIARPKSVSNILPKTSANPNSGIALTRSESLLTPRKISMSGSMRYKSTETTDDSLGQEKSSNASTSTEGENEQLSKDETVSEKYQGNGTRYETPGPSGLQSLRKRKSSTNCLIPSESIKKKLMIPFNPILGKKKEYNKNYEKNYKSTAGTTSSDKFSKSTTGGEGGGSNNEGHFQKILKKIIKDQSTHNMPVYEDKKDGEYFSSIVKFQTKFVVKSHSPKSSPDQAEIEAAVQALKKFGLEVGDRKNAKAVLNQFCEAAVGSHPNYHSFPSSSNLYLGIAQIHSLFASWSTGVDLETAPDFSKSAKFNEDILLQVKTIDSVPKDQENSEQSCAKVALQEANIDESQILNYKRAANELCLRGGGTLPIYEITFVSKKEDAQKVTTMTSYARENLTSLDSLSEDSSAEYDIMSNNFLTDDILLATSAQPSYTQDQAEEAAAKSLLEKMGVVVSPATADLRSYGQVLRENAVQWGYHLPQYHTFELKPQIDLGQMHFAVVSSKALHKFVESVSAESDRRLTSLNDARESAARRALLMLGYPQTFR